MGITLGQDRLTCSNPPPAGEFWDSIAQFYRRAYLRWIDGTKRRPEIRAERITEVVDLLKAGIKQRPGR